MSTEIYQIRAAYGTTKGLTGQGEEWIVDPVTGETIVRLWNGNLIVHTSSLSNGAVDGPTLLLEAA